ncbi:three component ABC system middle component [Kribbella sp. NPDC051620]|uniref:three component ABC system middle component n=1 Tax=Kribbella sp. NPDC051620 TaxID=3364120 RepID=UPI00379A1750
MAVASSETAALLNPAFIALVLRRAVEGHLEASAAPMPLVLAYPISGIALYPRARDALTNVITTNVTSWISRNPRLRAELPPRMASLVPFVNEGLLFGLRADIVILSDATLTLGGHGPHKSARGDSAEVVVTQRAARYLGRWFSQAGSPATVLALLGVRP